MQHRRRVIGGMVAVGGALAGSPLARAFQVEEAGPTAARAYRSVACSVGEAGLHRALFARLDAAYAAGALTADDLVAARAALTCPSCGCRVAAALTEILPPAGGDSIPR